MNEVKTYTEDQVTEAANAALQLIIDDIPCDDEWEEPLSLMVNTTISALTSGMQTTSEEAVLEHYGEDLDEFMSTRGF
ncbi:MULTISPECIES: hypothetical protein [Streptomyces]|uniref:Uncharacterized protein n=2 Tax=Streptomyces TaxID=1883 RepID=A0ABV9INM5_9ACTN